MVKALVILPSDLMGGSERYIQNFILQSTDVHFEVVVLSDRGGFDQNWQNVNADFKRMPVRKESLGVVILFLKLIFSKRKKFDFCFTSHVHCNALVSLLISLKLIVCHSLVFRESTRIFLWNKGLKLYWYKFLYKFYSPKASIICQTNEMKDDLLGSSATRITENRVVVIPNPVDYKLIQSLSKESLPSCIVFPGKSKLRNLVCVGRLVPEKGHKFLLEAMNFLPGDLHLYLVGDGYLKSELKNYAHLLGLSQRVHFLGDQVNPFPFVAAADVAVSSSVLEGFPNVVLEYMCCAKAVVCTVSTPSVSMLEGIEFCESASASLLAESLLTVLEKTPEQQEANLICMRKMAKQLDVGATALKIRKLCGVVS